MTPDIVLLAAVAVHKDRLYVAAAFSALPPHAEPTRLYLYDARKDPPWSYHDVGAWTVAVEKHRAAPGNRWTLCALSERGALERAGGGKVEVETIADAGLFRPGAAGYGYLSGLRDVGGTLHACGSGGQVYRRLQPGNWVHLDQTLLQPPGTDDLLLLRAIDGPALDDLYVGGDLPGPRGREGKLFHWNGERWRPIPIPRVRGLNAIFVEDREHVWVAGIDGALLVGNHRDGFESLSPQQSAHLFHDVIVHEGAVYLGSSFGLFRYDAERRRAVRVRTGLPSEPSYIASLDAADGVLWAVGPADILRFDGKTWARIAHPDLPDQGGGP
jgi:hypothetical protein